MLGKNSWSFWHFQSSDDLRILPNLLNSLIKIRTGNALNAASLSLDSWKAITDSDLLRELSVQRPLLQVRLSYKVRLILLKNIIFWSNLFQSAQNVYLNNLEKYLINASFNMFRMFLSVTTQNFQFNTYVLKNQGDKAKIDKRKVRKT
jgi:hypothetical protein